MPGPSSGKPVGCPRAALPDDDTVACPRVPSRRRAVLVYGHAFGGDAGHRDPKDGKRRGPAAAAMLTARPAGTGRRAAAAAAHEPPGREMNSLMCPPCIRCLTGTGHVLPVALPLCFQFASHREQAPDLRHQEADHRAEDHGRRWPAPSTVRSPSPCRSCRSSWSRDCAARLKSIRLTAVSVVTRHCAARRRPHALVEFEHHAVAGPDPGETQRVDREHQDGRDHDLVGRDRDHVRETGSRRSTRSGRRPDRARQPAGGRCSRATRTLRSAR